MPKKVSFGLKNTHYAVWSADTAGTPTPIEGSVKMTINVEGDSKNFYADDVPYAVLSTNLGYSGELEIAYAQKDVLKDILGWVIDANGMLVEPTDAQPAEVALLFEVGSNVSEDRYVFYSVTFDRPNLEANTKSDSTDPDTITLPFKAGSRNFTWGTGETLEIVKARCTKGDQAYANFLTAVATPAKPSN